MSCSQVIHTGVKRKKICAKRRELVFSKLSVHMYNFFFSIYGYSYLSYASLSSVSLKCIFLFIYIL